MMRNNKSYERGITLIALVVTIIILLILAGISINMLTGQNGILNRAKETKSETEIASKNERKELLEMEELINESQEGTNVKQAVDANPGTLEGEGTEDNPYVINSIEDLIYFAYDVRNGNTYDGKIVTLGLNLDFNSSKSYIDAFRTDYAEYGYDGELKTLLTTGEGFKSIGTITPYSEGKQYSFAGTFDGNNKIIYNLYLNKKTANSSSIGLFGSNYGTIKNIQIFNSNLFIDNTSTTFFGGIVGYNYNNIVNCKIRGNIKFNGSGFLIIGSITGRNDENSLIDSCQSNVNISGTNNNNCRIGGIYGDGSGVIENCYNMGNILSNTNGAENALGGIGGVGSSIIQKCYNIGNITGINKLNGVSVGGIQGGAATIVNCYNKGDIVSSSNGENNNAHASGIGISGEVTNCYNSGKINANSSGKYSRAAGISLNGKANNCYNMGNIKATGANITEINIGGIISLNGTSTNCYNIGTIQLEGGNVQKIGGIIGGSGTIIQCAYWSQTAEKGMDDGTDTATRIESIDNMPDILEILGNEFKEDTNNGYPILN